MCMESFGSPQDWDREEQDGWDVCGPDKPRVWAEGTDPEEALLRVLG